MTDTPPRLSDVPRCGVDGCDRPRWSPLPPSHKPTGPELLRRCALHEIASYNAEELAAWGEENAADMVRCARRQLAIEGDGLVPDY